ncbi:uncharacterized protein LOC111120118 isoform X1 [Crassostrea virginica]
MHGSVRLMSTSNRILTYVVLWSLVNSVCVFSQVLNENFGNQLDLYEKNLTWLTCPEGWSKIGSTCVLVLAELATFTQAESLCQSYGGGLLRIEGFNQNQRYGALIENVQNQQKDQFLSLGDWNGNSFWIGMYRDGDGQYHWVDGQVTNVGQGFWALDQPLGFQQGHKQCSSIDVKSVSDFGKYRWSLRPCEEKLPIVCQTVTCAVQQYRCQGESKCISADWLCDGIADCLDQSDERNCSGYCGNTYQGNQGTFQSPYYPHRYPSLSSCQWDIHTPLGTRVYLKFDDFNLENDYDVVSIYDGRSTLDPLVGNFSGDSLPTIPLSSSNNLLVQFHSDQDNQSTGFNVTWFAVVIPDCGGSLNATSQNQWLAFPAYNSLYVHNLICDWILSAPQDSISLQFEDVSLGAGDWVEVRDGDSENGVLFGRYTGDTLPPVIVSTGHHLFVRFTSDQKSDGRGFNVSFKAGCNDIIINKEAAIISSPGYRLGPSFTYPPNLQCSWQINSPTDRELAIVFDDNFDTEVDFDVLTIINGSSLEEAGALSQRFSGTKTPPVLRSLRGHFSISFTSDDLVSRPGWRATISPDCPVLSNLSDSMHISSRGQEYGTVVKFTCDTGYLLEGATTLICDINGTWSDSPPVCKKISCGSPSIPENGGIVSSNSSYYTGLVQYRCDVGYHSHDELISRCQRNGKWSSVPKCERIRCPKIGNLQNGSFINDFDNTFGQKVSFRCNGNFRLVNASEIICQEDGQWSALKPHCAPPLCPYLPIANGNTSVLHPEGGTWVQVHCKPGFQLLGSQNVWCGLDGTYQSSIPTCTDVNECEDKDLCHPHMCQNMMGSYKCRCSHGYQKLNETSNQCIDVDECERPNTCDHHCINTEGGYVCECNSSYKLYQGREAIIIDQRVIIPNKTCIVTCPAFNVSNGGRIFANTTKLSDETYIYPTSLFIYCPYGILPLWNSTTVFCQANGIWSHNIDRCTDQVCEALVPPINGSVYYDNQVLQLGTIATFNCSEGYILSGTPQKQCVSNGRSTFWKSGLSNSNLTFCLPRMCVEPTAPFNGYVNFTGRSVGSPATYSCKCGYELIGSRVRYCQGNGVWSGNGTICVDMDCPAPIPPSNGAVYSSTRMNYFGSQVSYTCQKGYTLTGSRQSTCSLPEQTTPPQLLRLLKVKFRGDNNINEHCASQYRAVLAAKFNESIHSLPGCSSVEMYVLDSSEGNVSGSEIIIGTSITLSGSPSAMCQCSEDIVQRTPSSIDWEITVNSCPTLNNKNPSTPQDKFEERVQDWKCPADFVLQGGAMDCAYNETPICRKVTDCLGSEDPNEITSTISTSNLPLSSQATSTISSTSSDVSQWTKSTSSVPPVVSQSTFNNILSTLSTTHTNQPETTTKYLHTSNTGFSDHATDVYTSTPSEASQTTLVSEQQTTQRHLTTVPDEGTRLTVTKSEALLSTSEAATTTKATTITTRVSSTTSSPMTKSVITEDSTWITTSLEPTEETAKVTTTIKTSSTTVTTVDKILPTTEAIATVPSATTTEVSSAISKDQTTPLATTRSELTITSSEYLTAETSTETSISTYSNEPQPISTDPSTAIEISPTTQQPTPTAAPPSTTMQMQSTTALSMNDSTQAQTTTDLPPKNTATEEQTTSQTLNTQPTQSVTVPSQTATTTPETTSKETKSDITEPYTTLTQSTTTNLKITTTTQGTLTKATTTIPQTYTTVDEDSTQPQTTSTKPQTTTAHPQTSTTQLQSITTQTKNTTSLPQTSTMQPQTTTTQPQTITTKPETNTQTEATTTQPQIITTDAETTTTQAQTTTTKSLTAPQTTTTEQQTTTTQQMLTTQQQTTTTQPQPTTTQPQTTNSQLQTTTTQPQSATTEPQTTTTQPHTITAKSLTTNTQPSTSTTETQTSTIQPQTTTTQSQFATTEPQTTTTQLQTTTIQPQTTTMQPETTTTHPQSTTTEPQTTTTKPKLSTTQPLTTTAEPETTTQPQTTTTQLLTSTIKLQTTREQQTTITQSQTSTSEPQTTTTQSLTSTTEPQTTTREQQTSTTQPQTTTAQPLTSTTESQTTTWEQQTSTTQSQTTTTQSQVTTTKPEISTTQPQTITSQPQTTTTQPLTSTTEPQTTTREQHTSTTQTTTTQPQGTTTEPETTTTQPQTTTSQPQTTTTQPQTTTTQPQTTTTDPQTNNTQPQTTPTEPQTTTTEFQTTNEQPQTSTLTTPSRTTQPETRTSEQQTTTTTTQSTTQPQTTTSEIQTTTTTTESTTTQPQTTTTAEQTTTTTIKSTITQPQTTTSQIQPTTTTTHSTTTQPQTTTTEEQTTTTTTQSTTTQPQTTTTEEQTTTTPAQSTTTQTQTTTTEEQTSTTTSQPTTTQPQTTTTEKQTTTTTSQPTTTQPQTTTTEEQTTTTTIQSTITQPQTTTSQIQPTTTTTQSTTTQPQTTTTEEQTTTTTTQSTTTQPQTSTTEEQTTTTTAQSTTTQPQTTTTEEQTTITTSKPTTTQPQTTTTEEQTTTTTTQSTTTQPQTTTTEEQTTTTTTQSTTTQPQTTTTEEQTTTTTSQPTTTQPQTTTTEEQTTTTTTQSTTTQPQTTTTEEQTTTTTTQSTTTQPQTTTTEEQTTTTTTQPQTTTSQVQTTTEALIAETTTPGTTLAASLPPLHYGTYWTFTYPASEVNEDALCENEMTTAYQNAFDSSKTAIGSEVSKKKECSKSVTLSVTQENPPIIASSQGYVFILKIGFSGLDQRTVESCATAVNTTINSKVGSLFNFNNPPCPQVYPMSSRTLSKRSEWMCASEAYRYDASQHKCVLKLSSAASFIATSLSDGQVDVVTQMIPQIQPTSLQPIVYPTTTTTTTNVPSSTSIITTTPTSRTVVEADKTPFFVNEVFFKFQTYNLTKLCTEKLSEKFQHSVDQASGAITKLLRRLPLCLHITDAELINTKSRFSHDPMSTRNQSYQFDLRLGNETKVPTPNELLLSVPFILRTRKFPLDDMESCINSSIKSLLEVGFESNISNLVRDIPSNICHKIELIDSRYTMDIQCPKPFGYNYNAKRCYTGPLPFMPVRLYLIQVTLSLASRGGTQCNISYQRSIRRHLETQNVNLLKNGLYDMCLMYNVVVKINTRMSNLTKVEDELRGNVGIVLMATSENPNYNGCVGGELHKYIFLTDIVPGGQIIPTDSPGECGNLTWEKNEIKGMADTCLEGYFKHDLLHRCIEEKSAELRANYTPNITWRSIPNHECLYSLALQMESYMKATINDTTTSDECSWMYRTVKSRLDLVNHSVLLELSILPFQWNQNAAKACLKLLVDNNQRVYDRFYQNLSTSCQVQDYLNPSVAYDFRCIKPNFKWNASTSSCVKVVKRKKRSRPSQTNLIKRRSVWEDDGPKIGRMARKKRNVAQNASKEVVASWLPMTPLCQDQQPPVFDFCPGVLNISMGRQGPLPFNFSLPRATDNSGVPPTLSYSPADIFRQPYPLKNETQIVIIATDQSTNVNNCTIKLNRVDDIPPDMICPDSVVVEQYSTKSNHTNISIANRASASDYSGIQNISYQILNNNGYSLPVRHFINVTAKATDGKGNTGSCHFLYEAKRADLNANGNVALNFSYSMGNQRASCKNTTFNLISNDVLSIANNSCIKTAEIYLGYQFRISALEVEQSFMYTVQVLLKRSKNGRIVEKDVLMMNLHVIQLNVHKEKFHQCMDNFTQEMIRKYQSGSYPTDPNCGGVNISLTATKSAILCPTDSVLNESSLICSQCDLGYYANQSSHSCQRCPSLDSGVIIPGDCIPCDSNLNTISCLNQCQPGEYSENGLQPCIKCPRGQYTPNTGARVCQRCQDGNYTEKTGAVSSTQCQAKCPVGQYSDTGLQPCLSCPWNHYADAEMSTSCTPCPQGQVTNTTGKTSPTDCQAIDFCMNGPCQNGGTCQRTLSVNWYSCHCPSGYYGYHCEHRYSVCESDPCLNGGTCTEQNNKPVCHCPTGYTGDFCEVPMSPCSCVHGRCRASSDGYYCSCFKGYMGDNCSQDIDECLPNPCLHGGRCLNQIGQYQCDCSETGYNGVNCSNPETETSQTVCFNEGIYVTASRSCSCPPGYSGAQCQNLVDECHYNFCGDNGYCIDEIMNFTCVCKPGFTGRFCTENLNECLANPCRNGARCIPGNNNFSCVCPPGFEGKQCEINRDECSPFPCNLTTAIDCKDGINDYTCVCREGWTGKWCEIRNHSCPYQCQNGGTCNGSALRCDCRAGFTGPYCEVELDECAGQPCLNGGTCTDLINAFNCTCPQGYTSPTCSVNVNECSSNPCKNGGTCLDLVNGFVCSCTGGFTGSDCSEEVSRCSSLPCENGAVCLDSSTSHGYLCDCPYGYKGQNCSEIVRCDSSPCRNGGSCTQEENDFNCSCTPGFKGKTCDIPLDPCLLRNVCQNGATCVNGTCLCTQYFTGFDCGKVKSSNFDLFFRGLNGSSSSAWITVEQEMSVCLWIRSFNTGQNKVMLTLAVNNTQTGKFLEIKEESYSVTYPQLTWYNTLNMDSGLWNHFCFTWTQKNSRSWSLYLNGSKIKSDDDMALPNRVMILLGQPLTPEPGQAQFYGEVSQVQVFPEQLQENDISTLSKACSPATKKSSNSYLELLANIRGDVTVIRPSVCGGQRCPTGYKGHDCSVKVDKNPPTVHGCPSDFRVVSSNRLNLVNWTEPIFSDDVGVVSVNQTHRSGEVLTYGEYAIQYWAFDAANNTAHCSFRVAVTPFDCEIPEVPEGVNHSCQTARDRSYCSLSCMNPGTHAFSESVPQFYKCGLSGLWDPPRGENFTFPACAAFSPPAAGVTGTVSFAGPTCTDNLKDRLVQIFKQTMAKWNQEFGLCPDQICNLQVRIHCSGDITDSLGRRRKRQAPDTSYLVRFNFPVNKTSLETTSLQPLDSIKTYVKKGEFNTDGFVAKNDSVTVTTQCNCLDGQVLMNTGTTEHCVNCALGSFHNKSESTCDLCHVGYYNDQEGKTACIPCPPGQTTQDPGAQQISKCYTICPAGQYAEDVTNVCKNCPLGYYQELSGSRMCHSCPNGQVTLQEGATSLEQCQAGCPKGQELSVRGTCVPCQPGFYKDQTTLASCQPCPYGTTTEAGGSTSLDKCNIAVCAAGSYRSDNQCFLCPLGQYQPRRGQTQCLQCGPGQTTVLEGSRRAADCVEGNVDECQTNVAQCGPNTICIDTPKSYECKCAEGSTLQKNGNCTVERQKEDIPQDNKTWIIVGCTVGAGVVILTVVIIILIYRCRKNEKEDCLQHVGALYRRDQVVVMPGGTAPRFYNQTFVSSRSSSLSLAGSDLELSPVMSPFRWNQSYLPEAEADLLPSFWPDEPLNISDSSENGSTEGAQSSSSGFDVNSDSYF